MNLFAIYLPVEDLDGAVKFYREVLGLDEAWREADTDVAFKLPDTEVVLLVSKPLAGDSKKAGPFLHIEDAKAFHEKHSGSMRVVLPPTDIPPGFSVSVEDPAGNVLRLFDTSKGGEEN